MTSYKLALFDFWKNIVVVNIIVTYFEDVHLFLTKLWLDVFPILNFLTYLCLQLF